MGRNIQALVWWPCIVICWKMPRKSMGSNSKAEESNAGISQLSLTQMDGKLLPVQDPGAQNSCLSQSVQLHTLVQHFVTPWTAARQASLSITNSWSSLKLMSIESVMPFSHLILCRPLLLLPLIPHSIRVFPQWVNSSHEVAKVLDFQL